MSLRPIKDIRFFEAESPVWPRSGSWDHLGTLYPAADKFQVAPTGTRYALALAAAGFQTRAYHHLYVVFTPGLPSAAVEISPLELEWWMVHVNVGMPLADWPIGDLSRQHDLLIQSATRALESLCRRDDLDGSMLAEVERRVLEQREELELVRLRKETRTYRVTVTYQIHPYGSGSPVFLEYQDRKSQQTGKIELVRVHDFEDVFALFDSVAISEGTIVLSPRSSATAKYTTRKYKTPFRVPVHRVLQGTPGC